MDPACDRLDREVVSGVVTEFRTTPLEVAAAAGVADAEATTDCGDPILAAAWAGDV